MATRPSARDAHRRQELAREAARLMLEGGIRDYHLAKRKALERLHLPAGTPLPRNQEVEDALLERQRLFGGARQAACLQRLRQVALEAMRELAAFKPRLVGPVLSGSADEHSAISLHLFAESPEEVGWHLMDRQIPYRHFEQRLRMSSSAVERVPGYAFTAGGVAVEMLVFSGRARRQTPLSPVDGRSMRRASLADVQALALEPAAGSDY